MATSTPVHTRLWTELRILYKINAHNAYLVILPTLVFAVASWANTAPENHNVAMVPVVLAWAYLFVYVFDTANQTAGADEDRINKPHRPIPSGLVDRTGLQRRFLIGCVLFLGLGFIASWATLVISAVWVAATAIASYWLPQHQYFLWKPGLNWLGAACQLAGGWCIFAPMTHASTAWVLIIATMVMIGLPIEDNRDIRGDRAIGRRSFSTMLGPRVVSTVFSLLMIAWPVLAAYLILPHGISSLAEAVAVTILAVLCFCAAVLAMQLRLPSAQRAAYIVYSFVHAAVAALPAVHLLS